MLIKYKDTNSIVLGIPSGGVPVASEIADALHLTIDFIIVRKIQIPYNPEAGFGAVAPDGEVILNERLLGQMGLTDTEKNAQIKKTKEIIKRRNQLFRGERPPPLLKDKNVIVVDDGLASGYTMLAAVRYVKRKMPHEVIIAVPTGAERTVNFILPEADKLLCLNVRSGFHFAVAEAYRNWYDLTDEEVISIVKKYF